MIGDVNGASVAKLRFKSGVYEKVQKGSTLIFVDTRISLKHGAGLVGKSRRAKNQINPFTPFDRTPTCDTQTDAVWASESLARKTCSINVKAVCTSGQLAHHRHRAI